MLNSRYFLPLPFIVIGIYTAIFSIVPFNGEDFALTKLFHYENIIQRLLWAIDRCELQANNWNARLGELNSIIQLSLPSIFFIITSLLSFILLNAYISSSLFKLESNFMNKLFISIGALFVFFPSMEVFFWKTANAGYLQPMLFSWASLYFYNRSDSLNLLNNNLSLLLLSSVSLFLLGLSFENVAPALVIYMLASIFVYKKVKVVKLYVPIVSLFLGWLILMTTPSTLLRSSFYHKQFNTDYASLEYIFSRIIDVVSVFFNSSLFLFVAALISFIYLFKSGKKLGQLLLPLLLSVFLVGSLILAPYTEPRAFLLTWIVLLGYVVEGIYVFYSQNNRQGLYLIFALYIGSSFILIKAYNIYTDFSKQAQKRHYDILMYIKKGGNEAVSVSEIFSRSNYSAKYINNRDVWYMANLNQVSNFYNYTLVADTKLVTSRITNLKLNIVDTNIQYAIETYDDSNLTLHIKGWAFCKGNMIDTSNKYILLKNPKQEYIFTTSEQFRPDVTKYFQADDLDRTGFEALILKKDISFGQYDVFLLLDDSSEQSLIPINKKINIESKF